jgi:hypothetical protein
MAVPPAARWGRTATWPCSRPCASPRCCSCGPSASRSPPPRPLPQEMFAAESLVPMGISVGPTQHLRVPESRGENITLCHITLRPYRCVEVIWSVLMYKGVAAEARTARAGAVHPDARALPRGHGGVRQKGTAPRGAEPPPQAHRWRIRCVLEHARRYYDLVILLVGFVSHE